MEQHFVPHSKHALVQVTLVLIKQHVLSQMVRHTQQQPAASVELLFLDVLMVHIASVQLTTAVLLQHAHPLMVKQQIPLEAYANVVQHIVQQQVSVLVPRTHAHHLLSLHVPIQPTL